MASDFPLKNLMSFRKPKDVADFLAYIETQNKYKWEPFGGRRDNFRDLATSKSGVKSIIERLTNSIDAVIEDKKQNRRTSEDDNVTSPRKAIENWFDIPKGHLSALDETKRRTMAQELINVYLDDSGVQRRPTITIRDKGTGLHPNEFAKTILSLGESMKVGKHYLLGAYGWGGSQTFIWCNGVTDATKSLTLPLAVIISRKNPSLLIDEQKDEVGWTIVRYRDIPELKHGVFEYLTEVSGFIPTADPKLLPKEFSYGTQITHLAYNLEKYYGDMTLASYRLFQTLLFDPVLPFWIYDNRQKEGRTVSGNVSRLETDDKKLIEYKNVYNLNLDFGKITVKFWAFKVKQSGSYYLDSYLPQERSRDSIFITLNGQQYDSLSKQVIKDAGFSFLSDYLIFQIECDELSPQVKKNVFPSTRESIREEYREMFKQEIINIIRGDDELRNLEESRKKQSLMSGDKESTNAAKRLLDKILLVHMKQINVGAKSGEKPKHKKFKAKDPPTRLKILPENGTLEFIASEEKKITIETDAPDEFLVRDEISGAIILTLEDKTIKYDIRQGFLREGKINFYITILSEAKIGVQSKISCSLSYNGKVILTDSKEMEIIETPPPLPSNNPPTIFEISNEETPLEIKKGRRSLITLNCDGPDDFLSSGKNVTLEVSFLPDIGIKLIGKSDLVNHKIRVFLRCPDSAQIGSRCDIQCKLSTETKTLTARRPAIVILPPEGSGNGTGNKIKEIPDYDIQEVKKDDLNWITFRWDEKSVGTFKESGNTLILYVSLSNNNYSTSAETFDEETIKKFKAAYMSYIGFHLWQLSVAHTDEEGSKQELERVCQTVLLAIKQDPRFH